jgi:hypothetical protein
MLHKASYVLGFHILASDGEVGHVDDLLFDENLAIRYLVVDISNWIGGKAVLIPYDAVEKIDAPNKQISVSLSREAIKASPSAETAAVELIETLPPAII